MIIREVVETDTAGAWTAAANVQRSLPSLPLETQSLLASAEASALPEDVVALGEAVGAGVVRKQVNGVLKKSSSLRPSPSAEAVANRRSVHFDKRRPQTLELSALPATHCGRTRGGEFDVATGRLKEMCGDAEIDEG
jgi:hypothetical protein